MLSPKLKRVPMIRTSKHILKYQTKYKTDILKQIFSDYRNCLSYYISLIIKEELPLNRFLSSKELPEYSSIVKSHWKNLIYKQASEIVRSNIKSQSDKRYKRYKKVYSYFKRHNRQTKFVNKKFSELNLNSIIKRINIGINNVSMNLDYHIFDIKDNKSKEFNSFIKISTPYVDNNYKRLIYQTIHIPIKHHKHSNKFKEWNLKNTIRLSKINNNFYINLFYEKINLKLNLMELPLD